MARYVKVAAAQLGAIPEGTTREEMVERMLVLMEQAVADGVEIIAYPELALTPYFPKRIRSDADQFFEDEMPSKATKPLFEKAHQAGVAFHLGQDRRYPESSRALGLQGAEIIINGYNTPLYPLALDHNELVLRAGAYENSLFVIGVAKCGKEDGVEFIAGSCICDPLGQVLAKADRKSVV